ncbi:hypothetical protein TSUD_171420 [Trifolium subterraneum]|uniref:Amidohydrolase-related domain-containing protein n=1 Tax=Trifolium subterraneum TaxID=3900 RepID=A0A2Z6M709_TRISU|nr:hypothetical protein TSUD_171420 [Trifolium subterraneum]
MTVLSSFSVVAPNHCFRFRSSATTNTIRMSLTETPSISKIIDSHLHVWASPQEASKFPYSPGQEPNLPGHVDFLLQCMEEAGVDGALIVQPINHKFDHSYVTRMDIALLDSTLICGHLMTNEIGKAIFKRAGELNVPVGFMCMKLCTEFPSTVVLLDHLAFCKPPLNDEEGLVFSKLLNLSRFPQVYVKFSALFRVSRTKFPYLDLSPHLSQVVSSFGANHVIWGSDFPFVVPECGYKGAKEAVHLIANQIPLPSSDLEWIMGKTAAQLFQSQLSSAK